MKRLKFSSVFFITMIWALSSVAQKLPDTQTKSVFATSPVKIDGKLTEATDFQAFNKNTRLYYAIMNDKQNLYLVMKAEDQQNVNKILMGGITITFNRSGKKKDKEPATITFPVINRQARAQRGQGGYRQRMAQTPASGTDSAVREMRKEQVAGFREIKISGFPDITDSLISIYNEHGIKAALNFDSNGNAVYEMAVPLQALQLNPDSPKEFSYNIKLNGRQFGNGMNVVRMNGNFGGGAMEGGRVNFGGGGRPGFDLSMFEPTDFWGRYTLTKPNNN